MQGPAFLGVSLDSELFSREWVRRAIRYILSQHVTLELVLGDRLLAFNKTTHDNGNGEVVIDTVAAEGRIAKRASDVYQFLLSEVKRLSSNDQSRVVISTWNRHSDGQFVDIVRTLSISYATLPPFRRCVDLDVDVHLINQTESHNSRELHRKLCVLYVIEETAMIIRITESGKPFEYYPQEHIYTLTEIYRDSFAEYGLTVESLIGRARTRQFTPLPLADIPSEVNNV
jgi:hypothetical protein